MNIEKKMMSLAMQYTGLNLNTFEQEVVNVKMRVGEIQYFQFVDSCERAVESVISRTFSCEKWYDLEKIGYNFKFYSKLFHVKQVTKASDNYTLEFINITDGKLKDKQKCFVMNGVLDAFKLLLQGMEFSQVYEIRIYFFADSMRMEIPINYCNWIAENSVISSD